MNMVFGIVGLKDQKFRTWRPIWRAERAAQELRREGKVQRSGGLLERRMRRKKRRQRRCRLRVERAARRELKRKVGRRLARWKM